MKNSLQKPTNRIEKLWVKSSTVFIEGLAYIQGYNSPKFSDLHKYLCLKNIWTQELLEYELGSIKRNELKAISHEGKTYDYTASGTATKGLKGIELSNLDEGIYEILISVSSQREIKEYLNLTLALKKSLNERSADNLFEYRLYQKNGKTYLSKRDIIGRNVPPESHVDVTESWVKQTVVHVEGEFVVPGVDITEFNRSKYYLIAQKPITQRQYVFELGQVKKTRLGKKIGNPFGDYDACYFATLGLKGIDTTNFELGNYDLYVSLAYKSEIFSAKLNKCLEIAPDGSRLLVNV
ncbi:hypothetical protein FHQ19_02135 [Pasteurellaceae bacterium UScroc12]|nr:hypothetical protein FHQ19_02135 [Pasteurellaceae bacterium UScroc12]